MTIRSLRQSFVLGMLASLAVVASAARADDRDLTKRFATFVEALDQVDEDRRNAALAALEQGAAASVSDALAALNPDYAKAVALTDDESSSAITALEPFAGSTDNPWLAADARWYIARSLMNAERFEEALPLLQQLVGEEAELTAHLAEAHYFLGACYSGMLQNDFADAAFVEFLELYPEAPERLRVAAWRLLQEIRGSAEDQMTAVTDRMEYSRRRLDIAEPGTETQTRQDEIVNLLAKLIEEQQKKECSSGSCNKSGQKQQQQSAQNQPKAQQQPSKSQTGGQSNVSNGQYVERTFEGETSPWSRLRDRSRDPANAAIREKLPARYREIVERYTDAVSGNEADDK